MRRYEEYEDSGIDWIPTIPKNWKLRRVDEVARIVRGNTAFKKDELLEIGQYVALQYGKTYKVDEVNQSFNFYVNDEFYKSNQTVKQGDTILISTSETIEDLGHTCYYNRTDLGLLGGEQLMLRPNTNLISPKFLYYFSKYYSNEIKKYATGLKVFRYNIDDLKNIFIPVFSVSEQQAIANYLDAKTQVIDKKVTLLEQKIETYKKLKRTLINQTITKGLNKNVPLKDSGISWIGQIPQHWEVKRFKDLYKCSMGNTILAEDLKENGKIPVYSATEEDKFFGYVDNVRLKLNPGDLVIPARGNSIGFSKVVKQSATSTQTTIACKRYSITNSKFVNYFLQGFKKRIFIFDDTAIPQFTVEDANHIEVLFPPKSEQEEIANYLDHKTATIDAIVSNIGKQIETLKQLRKTLINDVVTGKIKVVE